MIFLIVFFNFTSAMVINTSTRSLSGHHGVLNLGFIKHITKCDLMRLLYSVTALTERRRRSTAIIPCQHLIYQPAALVTSSCPFAAQMSDYLQMWAAGNTPALLRS